MNNKRVPPSVAQFVVGERAELLARIAELEAHIVGLECEAQVNAGMKAAKAQADKPSYASQMAKRWGSIMPEAQGVVMPERWNVPRPMWKDVRQPYGNPLNHADIEAAEKFNLALDEVARLNAAPVQQVGVPDGFVLAKETVVEMPDGSKELGYTTIGRVGIFNSAEEVFDAIRELDLPLGWVSMTTEQLLPGWMLTAAPAAPAADAGLVEAIDWLDDFVARCNGDDRGSCDSVNIIRAALAAHRAKGVV